MAITVLNDEVVYRGQRYKSLSEVARLITGTDASVQQFVRTSSHFLVTRGATTPDAIHQAYGLVGSMMNQQAAMLAFMDCFHLLAVVALAGLPLAFLARRFEIGKAASSAH